MDTYLHQRTVSTFDLGTLSAEIEAFWKQNKAPTDKLFPVQLIVEELALNVIKHGHHAGNDEQIEVALELGVNTALIIIRDNTPAFDPLEVKAPDTSLPLEKRRMGGMGIWLVRNKSKSFSYRYEHGFNIVTAEVMLNN